MAAVIWCDWLRSRSWSFRWWLAHIVGICWYGLHPIVNRICLCLLCILCEIGGGRNGNEEWVCGVVTIRVMIFWKLWDFEEKGEGSCCRFFSTVDTGIFLDMSQDRLTWPLHCKALIKRKRSSQAVYNAPGTIVEGLEVCIKRKEGP